MDIDHKIGESVTKCPKCGEEIKRVYGNPYVKIKGFSGRWG